MVYLHTKNNNINIRLKNKKIGILPLNLNSVYYLFNSIESHLMSEGISLRLSKKDLLTPLCFELLLQVIMYNMVHCIHPKIHSTYKNNKNLIAHSLDAEINYIRNAYLISKINHVHILANYFKNTPIMLALPGPSLDLDFVKEKRKSYLLMSVGRAAGKLIEAGIYPDFIYIQDINTSAWKNNFECIKNKTIPSILIANPLGRITPYQHCFKRILKPWNMYSFEKDNFPKIDEIPSSSISGAFSIVRLFGCNPVLFVGNDCGVNTPPRDSETLPEKMTNLSYEIIDKDILFTPNKKKKKLYLNFGDEFSVTTMNEYIAGSQWLKMVSRHDSELTGRKLFDRSKTNLCQFNSIIQDYSKLNNHFNHFIMPNLPYYDNKYSPQKYLLHKKNAYNFILKHLQKGVIPNSCLKKPYNSVLFNTSMWNNGSSTLSKNDIQIAIKNNTNLLNHIENTLSNKY